MNTNKIQIILIAIIIPIGALYLYASNQGVSIQKLFRDETPILRIGEIPIRVEIADSSEELIKGLSGRPDIGKMNGMLFIFPETAYHSIWMKDMNFPIDIIWISEDLKVINIERGVTPDTYPRSFRPKEPARYALETDIYYADTFGIEPGQLVKLPAGYLEK